ncbi:MAG TPA: hypothetical protein VF550_08005, partial [Polyangia bacterium]
MARKLRIQYPGAIYHVMNRGDHQELIFSDEDDRSLFEFSALMEARRQAEQEQEFKPLPRGWCVGSEAFRAEILQYIEEQRGKWHYG